MKISDVLFPTDFSTASEPAARVAKEIARQWGVGLHIVHVVPPITDPGDCVEQLTRAAHALGDGLRIETAALYGRVARRIVGYARDKHIGLIVLGTHGRTGLSHALLGSVAEAVVRLAPCPVLTVPTIKEVDRTVDDEMVEMAGPRGCIVCAAETDALICETCRTRIRGEALGTKLDSERAGHRGLPI